MLRYITDLGIIQIKYLKINELNNVLSYFSLFQHVNQLSPDYLVILF